MAAAPFQVGSDPHLGEGDVCNSCGWQRSVDVRLALLKAVLLPALIEPALNLALRLRITVYDALYVALAEARRIPFVSDGKELLMRMSAEPTFANLAQSGGDLMPP